jgi:hypothetical protein
MEPETSHRRTRLGERFFSKIINNLKEFLNTFIYVTENPVRAQIAVRVDEWEYGACGILKQATGTSWGNYRVLSYPCISALWATDTRRSSFAVYVFAFIQLLLGLFNNPVGYRTGPARNPQGFNAPHCAVPL